MAENKRVKDSELAQNYIEFIVKNKINYYDENAYDFGANYEFNGLDVQNLKNPVFEKLNNNSTKTFKK